MPRVRTLFLSDIHLGTRACQAERLLDFLREYAADELYLIGDIVDFWAMKRGIHWNAAQNTVVQKVLRRARHGERVVFIPGNHDEALRDYVDSAFGDIQVVEEAVHTMRDGRRFLLIHGDAFDQVTRHHRWVARLGDVSYNLLVRANRWVAKATPQEIVDLMPDAYKAGSPSLYKQGLLKNMIGYSEDGQMSMKAAQNVYKVLKQFEPSVIKAGDSIKLDQTFDNSFAKKAAAKYK